MADRNGLKGNPASKRISNVAAKAKRARSWARREKRREENRKAQHEREHANKVTLIRQKMDTGDMTPWQLAKAKRYARQHGAPSREAVGGPSWPVERERYGDYTTAA